MLPRFMLIGFLALLLSACISQPLHLKLRLGSEAMVWANAPIVLDGKTVGKVLSAKMEPPKGFLVELEILPEYKKLATEGVQFLVVQVPNQSNQRQIEIKPGPPRAPRLKEGETLQGSVDSRLLFPLDQVVESYTENQWNLSSGLDYFRAQVRRLPDTPQGQRLKEQWASIQDEIVQIEKSSQDAAKKELLLKLQSDLLALDRNLKVIFDTLPSP